MRIETGVSGGLWSRAEIKSRRLAVASKVQVWTVLDVIYINTFAIANATYASVL